MRKHTQRSVFSCRAGFFPSLTRTASANLIYFFISSWRSLQESWSVVGSPRSRFAISAASGSFRRLPLGLRSSIAPQKIRRLTCSISPTRSVQCSAAHSPIHPSRRSSSTSNEAVVSSGTRGRFLSLACSFLAIVFSRLEIESSFVSDVSRDIGVLMVPMECVSRRLVELTSVFERFFLTLRHELIVHFESHLPNI